PAELFSRALAVFEVPPTQMKGQFLLAELVTSAWGGRNRAGAPRSSPKHRFPGSRADFITWLV
ncbi:hypothetical protein MYX84_12825, partial [Acidobacteria bacterium AH-259-O06]|nr:hypothetical protein [Acidobacteria bacterium AH-259-O06]